MRLVFGFVLLIGLGLAGFAVYMAKGYIQANEEELARERAARAQIVPTTDVIITTAPIRYGQRLKQEDVKVIKWPVEGVPNGSFNEMAVLFPEGERPRTALRAMEIGEAIMDVKVTEPGEDAGVSSKLAAGKRAFTIRVDVSSGVSGFLRPGDHVDVYWTGSNVTAAGGTREFTKLIQPGVKIIAIDQSADEDRTNPVIARTVTVEVNPVEVAKLTQAQATGRLQLSLVGAEENELAGEVTIDQGLLLGIVEEEEVVVVEEQVCTQRIRRGAEVQIVEVECPQ